MAQNREKGGRVVFIGNIPYGITEEQIVDIFGRIGQVLNFRLVHDKETGKPKGFGFLEYGDVDAAASAVRNLNSFEIMGRELKVDYSNDNSGGNRGGNTTSNSNTGAGDGQQGSGRAPPPAHFNMNMSGQPPMLPNGAPPQLDQSSVLPKPPPGVPLEPGLTAPDAISKTIHATPPAQLLDIISRMKTLSMEDPAKATALLNDNPQIGYAIFQALLLLGLVDQGIIGQLVQQQQPAPPQQQQQQQMPPAPLPPYQQQQAPPPQPYAAPQPPPQANHYAPPPPTQQYNPYQQQHPGYVPTPPAAAQPAYHPPPQQQPPDPNAQLIQQVLGMSRDDIMRLDEVPRNQILALRQQLGAPVS